MRDAFATHVLKQTETYEQAGAIQEEPLVCRDSYGGSTISERHLPEIASTIDVCHILLLRRQKYAALSPCKPPTNMATSPLARLSNLGSLLSFEKDRQRDLLDMTVFCFRWCAVQKRTVRKTVSMPSYRKASNHLDQAKSLYESTNYRVAQIRERCIADDIQNHISH